MYGKRTQAPWDEGPSLWPPAGLQKVGEGGVGAWHLAQLCPITTTRKLRPWVCNPRKEDRNARAGLSAPSGSQKACCSPYPHCSAL